MHREGVSLRANRARQTLGSLTPRLFTALQTRRFLELPAYPPLEFSQSFSVPGVFFVPREVTYMATLDMAQPALQIVLLPFPKVLEPQAASHCLYIGNEHDEAGEPGSRATQERVQVRRLKEEESSSNAEPIKEERVQMLKIKL